MVAVVLRGERRTRQRPRRRSASNAATGRFPLSCTACGRNTSAAFPEFCQVPAPRLNRDIVSSMLDLMPSPRLIFREWDRHGTCSGLAPRAYFDNVRRARAVVKIPEAYLDLRSPLTVTPDEVEEAFVKANPGMTRAGHLGRLRHAGGSTRCASA